MKVTHPLVETVHSKQMGIPIPIPKTQLECRIYPARVQFFVIGEKVPSKEIAFSIKGPVENFLLKLNLSIGRVEVSFKDQLGFYSYFIEAKKKDLVLVLDRAPKKGIEIVNLSSSKATKEVLQRKEAYSLNLPAEEIDTSCDFLELGVHKKLDWQNMIIQEDLHRIIPIWMRLGHFFSTKKDTLAKEAAGSLRFLKEVNQAVEQDKRNQVYTLLQLLLKVGFEGILSPRIEDAYHQGILEEAKASSKESALPLLSYGAKILRSLFFKENDSEKPDSDKQASLYILPCIPAEFRVGRFYTKTDHEDELLFEWSNGKLKILSINPGANRRVFLHLPKEIKYARVRLHAKDSGKKLLNGAELQLVEEKKLFIDRFEK